MPRGRTARTTRPDDKKNYIDPAWRARQEFEKMRTTLTGYARQLTGNPKLRVIASTDGVSSTDGNDIRIYPPIELGENVVHPDRSLCHRRDSSGVMLCPACGAREYVIWIIHHEIAHNVEGTLRKPNKTTVVNALSILDELHPSDACDHASMLRGMIRLAPSPLAITARLNGYLHTAYSMIEDARVDVRIPLARPGLRITQQVRITDVFENGIKMPDGTRSYWRDAPLVGQVCAAVMLLASKLTVGPHWFAEEVWPYVEDNQIQEIIDLCQSLSDADDSFVLSVALWRRLEELKLIEISRCSKKSEENDDSDSDSSGDINSSDSGSNNSGSPSDQNESVKPELSNGQGQSGQTSQGFGGNYEYAESGSQDGSGGHADSEVSTDDTEADNSSPSPADNRNSSGGPSDRRGRNSGAGDADADEQGSDPQSGGRSGSDSVGEDSAAGDSSDTEDLAESSQSNHARSGSSVDEPDAGSFSEGEDSARERDSESNIQRDETSFSSLDEEDSDDTYSPLGEKVWEDAGLPSVAVQGEAEQNGEVEVIILLLNGMGHTHRRDDHEGDPLEAEHDDSGLLDPLDTDKTRSQIRSEIEAAGIAQVQALVFDTASREIAGLEVIEYPFEPRGWCKEYARQSEEDYRTSEDILGDNLLKTRTVFAANKRSRELRNLKSGKVNARVLGKRAPLQDERLFMKKVVPHKRDYMVVIGLDCSGSTMGRRNEQIKRAAYGQAELLHRVGVPFEVWGHTGDQHPDNFLVRGQSRSYEDYVWMLKVKEASEPWDNKTKERLVNMPGMSANLDGHTLEFYRKRAELSTATDKVILYYTDGAMPASNYNEELEILQREIEICSKRRIHLLGVGVGTSSPEAHGLETVRIDSDADIALVIARLADKLSN